MEGKITFGQVVISVIIANIALWFGFKPVEKIEQNIKVEEQAVWEVNVKKVKEVPIVRWETVLMNVSAYWRTFRI